METVVDLLSWVLLVTGSIFALIGGIGLLRLPDLFSRMHGAGITDTLGAGLVLSGLIVHAGIGLVTFKLIAVLFFLLVTSPPATHALAQSALTHGVQPRLTDEEYGPSST